MISCIHPRLILNPSLGELLAKFGRVEYPNGFTVFHRSRMCLYRYDKEFFYKLMNLVTQDNIDQFRVVDVSTGEYYPAFLYVGCGHCDLCREKKVSSLVNRCELETQLYDCPPVFFTLTYDEWNKPSDGVSVRELQLFLKRFRINLQRQGFPLLIRYLACSHYGKDTHRPHYHLIVWNLKPNNLFDYHRFAQLAQRSWNKGGLTWRVVNPARDTAFRYTARYLNKSSYVPKGCNKTFILQSRGNGGIGSNYYKMYSDEYLRKDVYEPKYLNKWNGKSYSVLMSSYALRKIAPTESQAYPSELRSAVRKFMLNFSVLKNRFPELKFLFENDYDLCRRKYEGAFFYFEPEPKEMGIHVEALSDSQVFGNCSESSRIIRRYLTRELFSTDRLSRARRFRSGILYIQRVQGGRGLSYISDRFYRVRKRHQLEEQRMYL